MHENQFGLLSEFLIPERSNLYTPVKSLWIVFVKIRPLNINFNWCIKNADRSSSEHPMCSLVGIADSCNKLFMKTTGNSGYTKKSPPPPPKVAPTPHNSPASMTDHLYEKAPPTTPYTFSA